MPKDVFSDQLRLNLIGFTILARFPFESEVRGVAGDSSVYVKVIFGAVRDQVQSFGNVHQISIVVMDKDGRTFFLTEKVIKFSFGFYRQDVNHETTNVRHIPVSFLPDILHAHLLNEDSERNVAQLILTVFSNGVTIP